MVVEFVLKQGQILDRDEIASVVGGVEVQEGRRVSQYSLLPIRRCRTVVVSDMVSHRSVVDEIRKTRVCALKAVECTII